MPKNEEMLPVPPKFSHYNGWKPQSVMRELDAMKACLVQLQKLVAPPPKARPKKDAAEDTDLG